MFAAEELDVDMSQMTHVRADTNVTPMPNGFGTSASNTIARGGPRVRSAAATAKQALLALASVQLGVPVTGLSVSKGRGLGRPLVRRVRLEVRFRRDRGPVASELTAAGIASTDASSDQVVRRLRESGHEQEHGTEEEHETKDREKGRPSTLARLLELVKTTCSAGECMNRAPWVE
jgi:CO/xanthine dehydrogenase Mo-binding subunit